MYQGDFKNYVVRMLNVSSRTVTTLAGGTGVSGSADGVKSTARFTSPVGVSLNALGTFAVVVS